MQYTLSVDRVLCRYLEIYNPTNETIDLAQYGFPNENNAVDIPGQYQYWNAFPAGAQIPPGGLYVICHPSADTAIQQFCDTHHAYLSNGDDGYCLVRGDPETYTVLDCVGDWLADPGAGWDVCGLGFTNDATIVRDCSVTVGNAGEWAATTSADNCQWSVLPSDSWSEGGFHGACGGTHTPRVQQLTELCEAQTDQDSCNAITRDTSLEAAELVHVPTCEWTSQRVTPAGGGRGQFVSTCGVSGALAAIERCEVNTNQQDCNQNRRRSGCIWEPMPTPDDNSTGLCSVEPLQIAEYLPYMCSGFAGSVVCDGALSGLCMTDETGACAVNQATLDVLHEEQCTDWVPGSDCALLADTCSAQRGGASSNFGCCRSAVESSGEELCITAENAFDGHDDCLDGQDESPCMWGFRTQQCADTGIFDACFPTVDRTANFQGRGGFGANNGNRTAFGGGGFGGNLNFTGGGFGGRGRRLQGGRGGFGVPQVFPDTCSPQCQGAIRAAKDLGCMETPELLGRTLSEITSEQWDSYEQICQCQNARGGFFANTDPNHLACCGNMTATMTTVQSLEHDDSATCSAEDAAAMATTLATCTQEPPFPDMVCEYAAICPDSIPGGLEMPTCVDYVIVDMFVQGDFSSSLGTEPGGSAVEAWAQYHLPGMLPGLDFKADEVLARFQGNAISIIVGVECPGGVCPENFVSGDPDCRRGNTTLGEPRFVCEGGNSLPEGAVLPSGTANVRITNTYIETESQPVGWDPAMEALCGDLEADFIETGQLMCLMDEEGASQRQNAQLFGLVATFGGRGGRGRRLQGFGGGGFGAPAAATCTETCQAAIQPLIDQCQEYSDIARQFAEPCAPENVIPGGFDAGCLNGVDHLIMTCGIESIADMSNGCSPECGAWAGPWWNACREHLSPIIDAETPGAALMIEGFVAMCPTPCADVTTIEVVETVVEAAVSEEDLRGALGATVGVDAGLIDISELKHVAVFSLSLPGQRASYDGATMSGAGVAAVDAIIEGVASATGVDAINVKLLSVTRTAYETVAPAGGGGGFGGGGFGGRPQEVDTQVAIEMEIQGSASSGIATSAASALTSDAALTTIAARIGVNPDAVAVVRAPKIKTEAAYSLPQGVDAPEDIALMTQLASSSGVFAVAQSVTLQVPTVVLRNDGTVCGVDGAVCTDDPTGSLIGSPPVSPQCPDLNADGYVGVDDLLNILAAFGRRC